MLSFDLSGNPGGGSLRKKLQVAVGDTLQDYSFDSIGQTQDAVLWLTVMLSFIAPDALTSLRFLSLSAADSSYGALIDNVRVTAVPEPSTVVLFGMALVAIRVRATTRRHALAAPRAGTSTRN